jgi:hypothetical protein
MLRKYLRIIGTAGLLAACGSQHSAQGGSTSPVTYIPGASIPVPNSKLTPGAVFPTAGIGQICRSGYTKSVRNVPTSEKKIVFGRYRLLYKPGKYEVDHLVPLELGGSNAITNLWPDPYAGSYGAHEKDKVENALHHAVCSGRLPLPNAQHIMETQWADGLVYVN